MSKIPEPGGPALGAQPSPSAGRPSASGPVIVGIESDEDDEDLGGVDGDEDDDDDDDDEDEDFLQDILLGDDNTNNPFSFAPLPNADRCTRDESLELRTRLRKEGPSKFIEATITNKTYTAKKLLTAFAISPPAFWEGRPDIVYYRLLGLAISRELSRRQKLKQFNTLEDAVDLIRSKRNILVITGAGISTNLGVPDFRSKKTGFYDQMRQLGFSSPEEIFEISTFDEDPSIFFTHSAETLPAPGKSTPTHAFIKLLDDREQLLTNYTQNIDNIEGNVGISPSKLIQCHGSWATFTCRKCKHKEPGQKYYEAVKLHQVPRCPECEVNPTSRLSVKTQLKRKRSSNSRSRDNPWDGSDEDEYDQIEEPGVMKPDITFFGEQLPDVFFNRFKEHDAERVDLVIVIGTSMMVAPVSEIPMALSPEIPHIYISRGPVKHIEFDITLLGDCDLISAELARRVGWSLQHPMLPETPKELEVVAEDADMGIWHVRPKGEPDPAVVAQETGQAEV